MNGPYEKPGRRRRALPGAGAPPFPLSGRPPIPLPLQNAAVTGKKGIHLARNGCVPALPLHTPKLFFSVCYNNSLRSLFIPGAALKAEAELGGQPL
jgi:hypothetical protein